MRWRSVEWDGEGLPEPVARVFYFLPVVAIPLAPDTRAPLQLTRLLVSRSLRRPDYFRSMRTLVIEADGSGTVVETAEPPPDSLPPGYVRLRVKAFAPSSQPARDGWGCAGSIVALSEDAHSSLAVGKEVYAYVPPPRPGARDEVRAAGGAGDADAAAAKAVAADESTNGKASELPPVLGPQVAEVVVLHSSFVALKPKNILFKEAASLVVPALCAYETVLKPSVRVGQSGLILCNCVDAFVSLVVQLFRHCVGGDGRVMIATLETASTDEGGEDAAAAFLGVPGDDVVGCSDLSDAQIEDMVLTVSDGARIDVVFNLAGAKMRNAAWAAARYGGNIVTAEDSPADAPPVDDAVEGAGLWRFDSSVAFRKSLSLHFMHVACRALHADAGDWESYGEQLDVLRDFIEAASVRCPPYQSAGSMKKADASMLSTIGCAVASRRARVYMA